MCRGILTKAALLIASMIPPASAIEYRGICEASAGAFISPSHFVIASDETNKLQIYERGKPDPIGDGIDMGTFTSFDKSDLEAAATIDDRVYWISSHSFDKRGRDERKRKVFFATKIVLINGVPTLTGVGVSAGSLRDPLARRAGVAPRDMNIEALAATPEGGLLIGLRAPLRNTEAIVVPFKNPAAVVDQGASPEFDPPMLVNLLGRGLRSMELVGTGERKYLIVAGPPADAENGFALFWWSGEERADPVEIKGIDLAGIKPEGAMAIPGQATVQLVSDDDNVCSDESPASNERKFRSIDVTQ